MNWDGLKSSSAAMDVGKIRISSVMKEQSINITPKRSGIQKDIGKCMGNFFAIALSSATSRVNLYIEIKTGERTGPHQGGGIKTRNWGLQKLFGQPMKTFNQK